MMIDTSPRFFCDAVTGDWRTDPWPRMAFGDALDALAAEKHTPGTMWVGVLPSAPSDGKFDLRRTRFAAPRRRLICAPGAIALAIVAVAILLLALFVFRAG